MSPAHSLDFRAAGAVLVHRFPHAAGMRKRGRDRHAYGDKNPREQKDKQQSGSQAMHGYKMLVTRIGDARPTRKSLAHDMSGRISK